MHVHSNRNTVWTVNYDIPEQINLSKTYRSQYSSKSEIGCVEVSAMIVLTLSGPGGGENLPAQFLIPPRCCMGGGRNLTPYDFSFGI